MYLLALGLTFITIFGIALGIVVFRRNYSPSHMAPPIALSLLIAGYTRVTYAEFSLVLLPVIISSWEALKLLAHRCNMKAIRGINALV
jgi:hypothetical protein